MKKQPIDMYEQKNREKMCKYTYICYNDIPLSDCYINIINFL